MSFRELRNFTEIMRSLGYPRLISVENFRTPNFQLVADVLYWMIKRYDPAIHVTDEIDTEDDRVEFLCTAAQAMAAKAKIKLNTKRLYAADGRAVRELLKIAQELYSASRVQARKEDGEGEEASSMPSQLKNIKGARSLATEITEGGARLFDLLGKERHVRHERTKALKFLDSIAGNLDNTAEHEYVEKSIRELVSAMKENIEDMQKQTRDLEGTEQDLDAKIKRKEAELTRLEKTLKRLQTVRPAFMDEYEKLEVDLQRHYESYLERFRNLDYLEHELDMYHKAEKEKLDENERERMRIQAKIREEELAALRGKGVDDRKFVDGAGGGFQDRPQQPDGGAGGLSGRLDMHRRPEGQVRTMGGMEDESDVSTNSEPDSEDSRSIQSGDEGLSSGSESGSMIEEDDSDASGSLGSQDSGDEGFSERSDEGF